MRPWLVDGRGQQLHRGGPGAPLLRGVPPFHINGGGQICCRGKKIRFTPLQLTSPSAHRLNVWCHVRLIFLFEEQNVWETQPPSRYHLFESLKQQNGSISQNAQKGIPHYLKSMWWSVASQWCALLIFCFDFDRRLSTGFRYYSSFVIIKNSPWQRFEIENTQTSKIIHGDFK